MRHALVVANETVDAASLREAVRARDHDLHVTVVSPVNEPRRGYVVYADTRRASAQRRLERALRHLREAGVSADGYVVEADPAAAVRDALAQLEPPVDEILVSTHPARKSGWLRRGVLERIRAAAGGLPVEHLVASESEPSAGAHPEAERRLKLALAQLRGEGIDAHGQVAHPDPFSAALEAVHDERVDEIVVSTFEPLSSSWLRRDLVERLRRETGLPVEHVIVEKAATEQPAAATEVPA